MLKRRWRIVTAVIILGLLLGLLMGLWYIKSMENDRTDRETQRSREDSGDTEESADKNTEAIKKEKIRVESPMFERVSECELRIKWSDQYNPYVEEYIVKRQENKDGAWETVGTLTSDQTAEERTLAVVDTLKDDGMQQYMYRVDVKVTDEDRYEATEGEMITASNILICIDPGHYAGRNLVQSEDGLGYAEGDVTLGIAKELSKILMDDYGVSSIMTRDSGSITIDGYTDGDLDGSHISLRGKYAKDSHLFLSLHTNANLDNANGYATNEQPVSINKPILILNEIACESEEMLEIANAVGRSVTQANSQAGLAAVKEFDAVGDQNDIREWTDFYNDKLEVPGTVCSRLGRNGDYYGVLRGAAEVGVPGMIIEHGYHTVPEVREQAMEGDLKEVWAQADALGIAEGLELTKEEEE